MECQHRPVPFGNGWGYCPDCDSIGKLDYRQPDSEGTGREAGRGQAEDKEQPIFNVVPGAANVAEDQSTTTGTS